MKAFVAILLTLILVAAQSGAATLFPVPCPARCHCAGGCEGDCCCVGQSDPSPAPQPATPAPSSPETGLGPLLLATTVETMFPAASRTGAPPVALPAIQFSQTPIFSRNCSFLL